MQPTPTSTTRRGLRALLAAPLEAHDRRVLVCGVAGILMTAQLSLQHAVGGHPVLAVVLDTVGALLAAASLRTAWCPPNAVAVGAVAICLVFCGVTAVVGGSQLVGNLTSDDRTLTCIDDVAPATIWTGMLVVDGHDPYTAYESLDAQRRLGCPTLHATPLRRGPLAQSATGPSAAEVRELTAESVRDRSLDVLERGFDYPAGTALIGVVGAHALLLLTGLGLLVAGVLVVRSAAPPSRRPLALALGAQTGALVLVGVVRTDGVALALLMVACSRPATRAGGVALGLACAVKQTAWYVAPALVVTAWRRGGPRRALGTVGGAALVFGVVNGPFVLMNASAWARGVLAPLTAGLFPGGTGPVNLVTTGLLPTTLLALLTALMYVAVTGGAIAAALLDRRLRGIGIVTSSLGLWVGQRSLDYYLGNLGPLAVVACGTPGPRPRSGGDHGGDVLRSAVRPDELLAAEERGLHPAV